MAQFSFNPNDLHRLNRLMFQVKGVALEESAGGHKSRKMGEGTDFLDFRQYTPGDDFRKVDWSLYGRLRQLFVRLHEAPRQLAVSLLIDESRSMQFGRPITKLQQAQRLACALGFVGLKSGDRVLAYGFADGIKRQLGPLGGVRALPMLVRFLQKLEGTGPSDLSAAVQQLRARRGARGLVIILSDFLNVPRCEQAMTQILACGGRVLAIQILDELDRGIGLKGTLRLEDSESGRQVDVKIDARTLGAYQKAFEEHRQQLENFCLKHRQHYIAATTGDNYLELVCEVLRSKAVVR